MMLKNWVTKTSFYVNPEEVYKGHFVLKQILNVDMYTCIGIFNINLGLAGFLMGYSHLK